MSKETLKNLIELVPDEDIETLHKVIIKFIPETKPESDEIEALLAGREDRNKNGTISHNEINWE